MCICACECGTRAYSTRTGPGHERTCVLVCVCECGAHVYSTRPGPGLACVLPTGRGVRPEFLLGLCATFPRVHARYGVRLGQCEQCILYVCVRSCMVVGVCSSSVVPLAVRSCMRALYSIWHGGLGGVVVYRGVTCTSVLSVHHLNSVWRGWYGQCTYLVRACTPCTCQHG